MGVGDAAAYFLSFCGGRVLVCLPFTPPRATALSSLRLHWLRIVAAVLCACVCVVCRMIRTDAVQASWSMKKGERRAESVLAKGSATQF